MSDHLYHAAWIAVRLLTIALCLAGIAYCIDWTIAYANAAYLFGLVPFGYGVFWAITADR
jgi:uncharacterized membrane protein HdeD (DUF308 family)